MVRTELFHVMVIHFPLAFLVVSFVLFIASRFTRNEFILKVSMWCLVIGTLGAVISGITGLIAEDIAPHTEQAHRIMETYHKPLGLAVVGMSLVLLAWSLAVRWKFSKVTGYAFLTGFAATIVALVLAGHYGHKMVYEYGMAINPKIIAGAEHHDHHGEAGAHEKMEEVMPGHHHEEDMKGMSHEEHQEGHEHHHGE